MRARKHVSDETITPGNTTRFKFAPGRYIGAWFRLTGTTDTAQTLATSEIGSMKVQRNSRTIQTETWEFYHDLGDLLHGNMEATLPTAGATAVSIFIPFYAPGLYNSMEVQSSDELVIFFEPESGLSTEFGANAITVTCTGIVDTEVPESYELDVREQDLTVTSTGRKNLDVTVNNVAYLFLEDSGSVISTVQIDVDKLTVEPSIDIDIATAWGNMEYRIETSGNTLTPYQTGSRAHLGSYLNDEIVVKPTFSSTGTITATSFSIQPSPAGVAEVSRRRVEGVIRENTQKANRKLRAFQQA